MNSVPEKFEQLRAVSRGDTTPPSGTTKTEIPEGQRRRLILKPENEYIPLTEERHGTRFSNYPSTGICPGKVSPSHKFRTIPPPGFALEGNAKNAGVPRLNLSLSGNRKPKILLFRLFRSSSVCRVWTSWRCRKTENRGGSWHVLQPDGCSVCLLLPCKAG